MADCNVCTNIIAPIILRTRNVQKYPGDDLGTWAEFTERTQCPTCSTIVQQTMIKNSGRIWHDDPYEATCQLCIKGPYESTFWIHSDYNCGHRHSAIDLLPGKALGSSTQYYLETGHSAIGELRIRTWSSYCDSNHHGKCHDLPPLQSLPRPSSVILIDVTSLCLVENDGTAQYLALSYVWGQIPETLELTRATAQNLFDVGALGLPEVDGKIPKTIMDAMKLTRSLDIRYLWVDRLCIIQDDPDQVAGQLQQMASIYASAYFTILALDGKDANHGLKGMPCNNADHPRYTQTMLQFTGQAKALVSIPWERLNTPWDKRGWTFQERVLSRRCLGFTGGTLFWQCKGAKWWEEIAAEPEGVPEGECWIERPSKDSDYSLVVDPWPNNSCYWRLVQLYAKRNLSFDIDAPRAFSAVIDTMSRTFPGGFHWGIPAFFFDIGLLWGTRIPLQRRGEFPSWSWMGWLHGGYLKTHTSQKSYNPDNTHEFPGNRKVNTDVEWYICETPGGKRSQINNSWHLYVAMRKSPRIALPHGWTCRKVECDEYSTGSAASTHDESIKTDEGDIEEYHNCERGESDTSELIVDGSVEEHKGGNKHRGNDVDDAYHDTDSDGDDKQHCAASKIATRTAFFHQSLGDGKAFAYPVPLTESPLGLSRHTWSRFLCFSTIRQHFVLDGTSFNPFPHDSNRVDDCLWMNLQNPGGIWAGVIESNFTRAEDAMDLKGCKCEVVVVSAEVVKRQHFSVFRELDCCDALKPLEVYEFYNVLWIEWQDGIAYRKGIGRVWKEVWDKQASEKVDVVLG